MATLGLTPFDTIFFVASFHHLIEPGTQRQVLDMVKNICAASGRIVLLNWNLRSEKNEKRYGSNWISESVMNIPFSGHPRHYYAFTLEELERLFLGSNLKIVHHRISESTDNFISVLELG